jgi:hypothetical protein
MRTADGYEKSFEPPRSEYDASWRP